jgi:hypothetical protein
MDTKNSGAGERKTQIIQLGKGGHTCTTKFWMQL